MLRWYADGKPHEDDYEHMRARDRGIVPETCCFLGGSIIATMSAKGLDPCSACPGDRAICQGRPRVISVSPDHAAVVNQASAAYADLRALQRQALASLTKDLPT